MKKSVILLMPLIFWNTGALADGATEQDLQACYGLEFQYEAVTPEVAFSIGNCFSELAASLPAGGTVYYAYELVPGELTNRNAVLHYASSWYEQASDYGHPEAEARLMLTWDKLWD
ncbi:MAG: hypothetical protein R3208_18610 [Ketobacteraceae bacterium]|nr:hypothetical protein [Ketobacteraceae bacterium]